MTSPQPSTPSGNESRLLVITGAAGRIGTFYRNWLHQRASAGDAPGQGAGGWRFRLVDIRPPAGARQDDEVVAGDDEGNLADLEVARRAVAGAHSVLHLAADPSPRADFYETLLDRNLKATYNVLLAAEEAGAKRVVFASSINAVNGYPEAYQSRAADVAWPGNVYGASKAWGEAVCGAFVARGKGKLSAIAVRIGGVTKREDINPDIRPDHASIVVTYEDLSRLFDCCLEGAPEVTFAVVNGLSRNRFLRMDLEGTMRLVGYAPQDDAFAIAASRASGDGSGVS